MSGEKLTSYTGASRVRTSAQGVTDGEQLGFPAIDPGSGGNSIASPLSSAHDGSSSRTWIDSEQEGAARISELSWPRSTTLVMWGSGWYSMRSRSVYQPPDRASLSWLETPGTLAVFQARKGWRSVSFATTLDASYCKGPDNHSQRTLVLPGQQQEVIES